jgi:hypothetical protein
MRAVSPFIIAYGACGACGAFFACLGGCDNGLPVSSFIDKLRVLAVQAEPPEVAPGAASTLSMLAVEPAHPAAAAAPLSAVWLACAIPPGVATPLPCGLDPGQLDATTLPPSCGSAADGGLCLLSTALDATLTPSTTLLGSAVSTELLVTVAVADTGAGAGACLLDTARNGGLPTEPDRCVISIKRVTVRDPTRSDADHPIAPPNHNPMLDRLDLRDQDGTVRSLLDPGATVPPVADQKTLSRTLSTLRHDDSAEQKSDGTYEAMSLSWFTTGGSIDGGRSTFDPPGCASQDACATTPPVTTADTTWNAPTATQAAAQIDPDGRLRFWAVLRDDRGGVGWLQGGLSVK